MKATRFFTYSEIRISTWQLKFVSSPLPYFSTLSLCEMFYWQLVMGPCFSKSSNVSQPMYQFSGNYLSESMSLIYAVFSLLYGFNSFYTLTCAVCFLFTLSFDFVFFSSFDLIFVRCVKGRDQLLESRKQREGFQALPHSRTRSSRVKTQKTTVF